MGLDCFGAIESGDLHAFSVENLFPAAYEGRGDKGQRPWPMRRREEEWRRRSYLLISIDGCRSLRRLSPCQRRFAPTVIGYISESLIGFVGILRGLFRCPSEIRPSAPGSVHPPTRFVSRPAPTARCCHKDSTSPGLADFEG